MDIYEVKCLLGYFAFSGAVIGLVALVFTYSPGPRAKASVNDLADIRQELQGIRRALEKGAFCR